MVEHQAAPDAVEAADKLRSLAVESLGLRIAAVRRQLDTCKSKLRRADLEAELQALELEELLT